MSLPTPLSSFVACVLLSPIALAQSADSEIVPGDPAAAERFGEAVAIDGTRALIGTYRDGELGSQVGSATVFERDSVGDWNEVVELVASDFGAGAIFGFSVALSGDCAVVGAPQAGQGAAYVFERDGSGVWSEVKKLEPTGVFGFVLFGSAVAIDGEVILVGSPGTDGDGNDSGSVFAFLRDPVLGWTHTQELKAGDADAADRFGERLALEGERAIIAAAGNSDDGNLSGAAYVFDRDASGTWGESQKLTASDAEAFDRFGFDVDVSGNRVLIGARFATGQANNSGAAYVFDRDLGGTWSETKKLIAANGNGSSDAFGWAVALAGDRALVGSPFKATGVGFLVGTAYSYEIDSSGEWTEIDFFVAENGGSGENLGIGVDLDRTGTRGMVGASGGGSANIAGAAYGLDYSPLNGSPARLSVTTGGQQAMNVNFPGDGAVDTYFILGTHSGVSPGLTLFPGLDLPLNPGFYFVYTASNPNSPVLGGSFGSLDDAGNATAAFNLPGGSLLFLAGQTFHHAALGGSNGIPSVASNALPVLFVL